MNRDTTLQELITEERIQKRLVEVASLVDLHYKGQEVVVVAIMKGAICIVADLLRVLETPCTLECIRASSYGARGTIRGSLSIDGVETLDITSKHVLLVDDIFDSGHTLLGVIEKLREKKPLSLQTFVLLSKDVERTSSYQPDYILFSVPNRFVIGWGLDDQEKYRGLRGIYTKELS